jgi:hypothetical protein
VIKDEQLSDEAVEAAAITELRELNGWPNDMVTRQIWDTMHISEKTRLLKKARAVLAAGLAAWPGMECRPTFTPSRIILPLTQEPRT